MRGEIIKPFLPLEKHPNLANEHLTNLYPGDEIYVFETKNDKWGRGYCLTKPFPNDFTITSVNLDQLPGVNVRVVVFPLKYVKIILKVPIPSGETEIDTANAAVSNHVPTIRESEFARSQAFLGNADFTSESKVDIPPLPQHRLEDGDDFLMEIKHSLEVLTSHIFALYSIGEFKLFNKLSSIYHDLYEARIKLHNNLLMSSEIQVTKETATMLLNKIPKELASRSVRLNASSFDLDNRYTDTSGYKAILARDEKSGNLLSSANSTPSKLALNQMLCALAPKFPIYSYTAKNRFSLEPSPNKHSKHEFPSHILVDFKSVSGSSAYEPPGFAGMTAYLYIRNNRKRLTEAFAIHTKSVDDLIRVENISASLFRNIPVNETIMSRSYLVAVLVEEVDINIKSGNTPVIRRVKKGVAAGVADITRVFSKKQGSLQSGSAHPFTIKLFGSYMNKKGKTDVPNKGWGELVDRIISGVDYGVAVNPRAETLVVSVKEFKHQISEQSTDMVNTGPISGIKPIFFDPLAENYERIYLSLGKISLLNGGNQDDLLTIEVSAPNNDMINFAKASNQQQMPTWQFVSVYLDEVIGEIIKINGVSLKNPSKNVSKEDYISLSLYVNGVLAGSGKLLYKSGNRLVEFNKKKIYAVDIISNTHNQPMARLELSTEYIGKVYNSDASIDKIFQFENSFKGGQKEIDDVSTALLEFCKLEISQLLKYFPELLSSFYGIIEAAKQQPKSASIQDLENNTFRAIVHLLDILFGKHNQYLYLIDNFIARYSDYPSTGTFMITKAANVFANAEKEWDSMGRSLCRVVSLIVKLSLVEVVDSKNMKELDVALTKFFKSGSIFVSIDNPSFINDQILFIETVDCVLAFGKGLDQLKIFKYIVSFIDSVGAKGLSSGVEPTEGRRNVPKVHNILISKLLLIHRLLGRSTVATPETRSLLIPKAVSWAMEVLLGNIDLDGSRLALTVLNYVCSMLWETSLENENVKEVNLCYSISKLLPTLGRILVSHNKHVRSTDSFSYKKNFSQVFSNEYPFNEVTVDSTVNDEIVVEVLCELSTVFCFVAKLGMKIAGSDGFAKILAKKQDGDFVDLEKYLVNQFHGDDILSLISAVKIIRHGKFFPEEKWLSFYSMLAEGCLSAMELIKPILIVQHIPLLEKAESFDKVLWGNYLLTSLRLATLAPVSTEHLTDVPRKACHQLTGTMRTRIASLIKEVWERLSRGASEDDKSRFFLSEFGGYQLHFIHGEYSILEPLMLFALQKNPACQSVAAKVLWSILIAEYILNSTIIDVERECLVGLNVIYSRNNYKPGTSEQDNFINKMKAIIRIDREDEAFIVIYKFIETLQGFMLVLNDLNSVPVGPEFDDDRTFHMLNIKAYLKNANKPELFHSFINSMFEDNLAKHDYIQAALSLELLGAVYSWDHNIMVPASFRPIFPEQTAFERKETIYKIIASNYIKGNSLERAIDTYNELLDAYNTYTYDLKSFAYVHNKLAKLYLELESSDKLSPSFFRVAFIGAGFPSNIRGKEQIYEGLPFEHITSIHERLLRLYPGARIISDDNEARKLKEKIQTGRYLHVNTVDPVNEISEKLFNTSIGVRQYARNKDLRFFTVMRKIPGSSSVFDLWTEETTFETYLSFPTLMNRSDIKETRVVKLSPLDNAVRSLMKKNIELIQVESMINVAVKEKADYLTLLHDLSRQLFGTVDSPVNGGVGQYRGFFNQEEYKDEKYADQIRLLKNAFEDLATTLNRTLNLHGKLISTSMTGSQDALVELFRKNFSQEIKDLKLNTDYEQSLLQHTSTINGRYSVSRIPTNNSGITNGMISGKPSGMNTGITSGMNSSSSLVGSKVQRISSRNSLVSSNSGLSGISSSQTNEIESSASTIKSKRSMLPWRSKQ